MREVDDDRTRTTEGEVAAEQVNATPSKRSKSVIDEDSEEGHRLRRFLWEHRTTIGGSAAKR